jgi:hypothetical protein
MRRVIAFAALLCACVGCENTPFYKDSTNDWFNNHSAGPMPTGQPGQPGQPAQPNQPAQQSQPFQPAGGQK